MTQDPSQKTARTLVMSSSQRWILRCCSSYTPLLRDHDLRRKKRGYWDVTCVLWEKSDSLAYGKGSKLWICCCPLIILRGKIWLVTSWLETKAHSLSRSRSLLRSSPLFLGLIRVLIPHGILALTCTYPCLRGFHASGFIFCCYNRTLETGKFIRKSFILAYGSGNLKVPDQ